MVTGYATLSGSIPDVSSMYEQMYFVKARYEPFPILWCIEEMDWPCTDCKTPVCLFDAVMDVNHDPVYCRNCEPVAIERSRKLWKEMME